MVLPPSPRASASPTPRAAVGRPGPDAPPSRRSAAPRAAALALALAASLTLDGCCKERPALGEPSPGSPGGCDEGMVLVGTACVDTHEASLVEIDGDTERPHPHYQPVGKARVKAVSRAGVMPQAYISQQEAAAACAEAGKRLCTDDEWELACGALYPYGLAHVAGACNDAAAVSPLARYYGQREFGQGHRWEELNDPRLNQVAGGLAPTGSHQACRGAQGTFDMVGNLHEWTADPEGTFRGGFYLDTKLHGEGCRYVTTAHNATYRDYSIGFRCCKDAPR